MPGTREHRDQLLELRRTSGSPPVRRIFSTPRRRKMRGEA
jgi:hypothetical protein